MNKRSKNQKYNQISFMKDKKHQKYNKVKIKY